MSLSAVIFDWGGTLTPWRDVDLHERWLTYARIYQPDRAAELANALHTAEQARWSHMFESAGQSGTGALESMLEDHGVDTSSPLHRDALDAYLAGWEPNTHTDIEALPLLERLKGHGLKLAVLSNTMWPRRYHEWVLERDGVLHLFDHLTFTSETPMAKPHSSVFTEVAYALSVEPTECVFVGDRLFDDIHGSQAVGMRGIWIPHSTIPVEQGLALGITPSATVDRLGDVYDVVMNWATLNA